VPNGEGAHNNWNNSETVTPESLIWNTDETAFNTLNNGFDNWTVNANENTFRLTESGMSSIFTGNHRELNMSGDKFADETIYVTKDTGTLLDNTNFFNIISPLPKEGLVQESPQRATRSMMRPCRSIH